MAEYAGESRGSRGADSLMRTLYDELHKLATARLKKQPRQTLQPTELIHEVYERLVKKGKGGWDNRGHFFGAAARAMKYVLADHAKKKASLKAGGGKILVHLTMTLPDGDWDLPAEDLLWLHGALEKLQEEYPEHAEIILLHSFAGLTVAEVAEIMNLSKPTTERRLRFARAWMQSHGKS